MKRTFLPRVGRAAAHIEMAISFGLFILFVFFLLFYLRPVRNQNIGGVLTDAVELGMKQKTYVQLIEIPLIITDSSLEGAISCFSVPSPFLTLNSEKIFIRNSSVRSVGFSLQAGNMNIEYAGRAYYVHYSNVSFAPPETTPSNCPELNLSQYSFGAARTYNLYFFESLQTFKRDYGTDYASLKDSISFPALADFIVNITDISLSTSIISISRPKPQRVEVTGKDIPIELLMIDGSTTKAIMNIQVW